MAKKRFVDVEDEVEEVEVRTSKLPIDSTGAGKALLGFCELPVTMLHPFTLKNGSDFSRHNEVLSEKFVETIKEIGVLEALIVRQSPSNMGMYEIIAGESRWDHAKEAGLEVVPCRVMDFNDKQAKMAFNITNLMRRELTVRDKINGWYAFFQEMTAESNGLAELKAAIEDDQLGVMGPAGSRSLKLRSIQRYVKMHDLIDEWIDRLDAETMTVRAGERMAFFPDEIQRQLLPYKVPESKLNWLYEIYKGKNKRIPWSPNLIQDNFELANPPETEKTKPESVELTKEEKAARRQERKFNKAFKQSTPKLLTVAREKLRPEDYERADEVISKALELYYQQETRE